VSPWLYNEVSNSNVTNEICTTTLFLSQEIGETKYIVSPLSKSWGSPLQLGPWNQPKNQSCYLAYFVRL